MRPTVVIVALAVLLLIVNIGNGCAPSFRTLKEVSDGSSSLPVAPGNGGGGVQGGDICGSQKLESVGLADKPMKIGYLEEKRVSYFEREDGWIVVEGDQLILSKGSLPQKPLPAGFSQGVGVPKSDRWPGGRVPYVVSSNLPGVSRINEAVAHWNSKLVGYIQFVPKTSSDTDYVLFEPADDGCSAPVGYYANAGVHPVEISDYCTAGNVIHEMGHVLGLNHEQNRLDRDNYVTIQTDRVADGYLANFEIDSTNQNFGSYDFGSIMHYPLDAFSKDCLLTIVPKVSIPAGVTIGQRQALSAGDIASIKILYAP